jgi:hypothetical protein
MKILQMEAAKVIWPISLMTFIWPILGLRWNMYILIAFTFSERWTWYVEKWFVRYLSVNVHQQKMKSNKEVREHVSLIHFRNKNSRSLFIFAVSVYSMSDQNGVILLNYLDVFFSSSLSISSAVICKNTAFHAQRESLMA